MYEDKTPEAIKAEILAAIRQSQGLSAMAGGFADGVAGPVAEQLSEAYRALEGVTSMLFVDESSGGYIDLVGGQYYNITRREGTRAYCDISFSGTPGLVIPKGTAFLTAGGLSYALMAAVALGPEGTGRGRLEAAEAGSAYNVEAGAIDRMYVNLTGLTDYHSEAAAGGTDAESDAALLARVREKVPGITLRTSLIAGFPGETKENFEHLCEFVKKSEFERLGCFAYSQEDGTPAGEREDQVDEQLRTDRAELVMAEQMTIMARQNAAKVGSSILCVVEGFDRYGECFFGRSEADAPDIDGKVFFSCKNKLAVGQFVTVKVEDVMDLDLIGVVTDEHPE